MDIDKNLIDRWATLCEGRNLLREHEHYYDPDTGMSYDDEGNSWRGAPNPKYDVSGYWPYSGHRSWWKGGGSYRRRPNTPKTIEKDKLYFGRPAKTDSSLIYFLLQACGLFLGKYKLPSGVEERTPEQYLDNIRALSEALCGKEFSELKSKETREQHVQRFFDHCILYFQQEKGNRSSDKLKGVLEDAFETK